jgi:arylsulfatase A-like enzyme
MFAVRLLLVVTVSLFGGAIGCSRPADPPNLLLITVDTLRADHLGAWGYDKPTSPRIDGLAAQSVVFERAYAHASWTLPALASLMTSLYTTTHRCWSASTRLDESFTTLAERLEARGYATAAIVDQTFLRRVFGLDQGFRHFDEQLTWFKVDSRDNSTAEDSATADQVSERAIVWLQGRTADARPWMLWLNYFDPHNEYLLHDGVSERFGTERPVDRYDGEIFHADRHVGAVLDHLETAGLADDTIVVLTADHGEEFSDHGGELHGTTLHVEQLHVPLLIRAPGFSPRRIREAVRQVDVQPTLLELLDAPPAQEIEGESLVPAMRGETLGTRPVFAELGSGPSRYQMRSLAYGDHKLIIRSVGSRPLHLFDTQTDPREHKNLVRERADQRRDLNRRIQELVRGAEHKGRSYARAGKPELHPDDIARLRELGYVVEGGDAKDPEAREVP